MKWEKQPDDAWGSNIQQWELETPNHEIRVWTYPDGTFEYDNGFEAENEQHLEATNLEDAKAEAIRLTIRRFNNDRAYLQESIELLKEML